MWPTREIKVLPNIFAKGFPGNRDELYRAGIRIAVSVAMLLSIRLSGHLASTRENPESRSETIQFLCSHRSLMGLDSQ